MILLLPRRTHVPAACVMAGGFNTAVSTNGRRLERAGSMGNGPHLAAQGQQQQQFYFIIILFKKNLLSDRENKSNELVFSVPFSRHVL